MGSNLFNDQFSKEKSQRPTKKSGRPISAPYFQQDTKPNHLNLAAKGRDYSVVLAGGEGKKKTKKLLSSNLTTQVKQKLLTVSFSATKIMNHGGGMQADGGHGGVVYKRASSYKLLYRVGRGSFGQVFKAIDTSNMKEVAVKVIDMGNADDEIWETMAEISSMSQLQNPNIVQYYTSFMEDNFLWIIMEYLGVGSVADILKVIGGLSEKQCRFIIYFMLQALEYLHSNQKLHRDIKAANVLVGSNTDIKLADFGVAGQLTQSVKQRHTFVGTPYWMAPEVIQQQMYNTAADIWALGITAIEIFNKNPPHANTNPVRALFAIVNNDPPTIMNSSNSVFKNFVSSCLQKTPINRPSASELLKHHWLSKKQNKKVMLEVINNYQMHNKKPVALPQDKLSIDEVLEIHPKTKDKDRAPAFELYPTVMNVKDVKKRITIKKSQSPPKINQNAVKTSIKAPKKLLKNDGTLMIHDNQTDPNTVEIRSTRATNQKVDLKILKNYNRKSQTLSDYAAVPDDNTTRVKNNIRSKLNVSSNGNEKVAGKRNLAKKLSAVLSDSTLDNLHSNYDNPGTVSTPNPFEKMLNIKKSIQKTQNSESSHHNGDDQNINKPAAIHNEATYRINRVPNKEMNDLKSTANKNCVPLLIDTLKKYQQVAKIDDNDTDDPIIIMKKQIESCDSNSLTKVNTFLKEWASFCYSIHSK